MAAETQGQLDRGQAWLEQLLDLMGTPAQVQVERRVDDLAGEVLVPSDESEVPATCWMTIDHAALDPTQAEHLLGSHGSVLDAMQYLANTILNLGQPQDQQVAYTIELGGYRAKRQAELRAMAEQAAAQVRQTGEEVEMEALSSAERRQVHTFLQTCSDLETYSHGREPDRRLVVRPIQS